MNIVFMGTPDIAVNSLEALAEKFQVSAVFTQPDKPVGRKQILTAPPVKVTAEKLGIPVYQPASMRDGQALEILKEIKPDIIVVIAYGKILPKEILEIAKFGCVNAHASILPKYRGASPIQWCIVCGETETGVTTQLMDEGIDTGDILEISKVDIAQNETAAELYDRLAVVAADLLVSTVDKLAKGEITPTPQNHDEATYAPIIKKEMALIDFNKDAKTINNAIRGYNSWPVAYFMLGERRLKVFSAEVGEPTNEKAGTVIKADKEFIIAAGNGTSIKLNEVQLEGSKRMSAAVLLQGNKIEVKSVL